MSKIICDVCGSAYSDTASQCPICGTAKRDDNFASVASESNGAESSYNYVKGGRFSHANVRKHNSGKELSRKPVEKQPEATGAMPPLMVEKQERPVQPKPERKPEPKPVQQEKRPERKPAPQEDRDDDRIGRSTNLILIIIVLVLLLAVVFAGVYVVQHYKELFDTETNPSESVSETQQTVGGVRIPCSSITLPALETLETDGKPVKLDVVFTPASTTDDKRFTSSDPYVATVNDKGVITVHSSGQVTIAITCGDQSAELILNCVLRDPSATTQPTQPTVQEGKLMFVNAKNEVNPTDITFTKYGDEFQLYAGDIDAALVTFTSSDPTVVTVDAAGKIKVVGKGTAVITAQYGEQNVECKIICSKVEIPVKTSYKIKFSLDDPLVGDITIKVGERQTIQLLDAETLAPISGLTWYTSMEGYISLEVTGTGVRVTGTEVTKGVKGVEYVRVMCDYEGVTYTCIVRVKAAPTEG